MAMESTPNDEALIERFSNLPDFFDAINSTTRDILIFTHVSPSTVAAIEKERGNQHSKFRLRRYDANGHILIITIPTKLHESLHLLLYQEYISQLVRCNMRYNWLPMGSTTFRRLGHPEGDGGEGDSSGGPYPERAGKNVWPTLVIEAGDSESLEELRADIRWWFSTSDHQVKMVLLAKCHRAGGQIILEKWEEDESQQQQGAITRSRTAAVSQPTLNPVKRQTVTITRDTTANPASYNVSSGALVLGFKVLFLREPGPTEGDFVVSVQDLERYAEMVWSNEED